MNPVHVSGSKIILFLDSPKLEELCGVIAHIDPLEKRDTSAKSNFHWQLLKCRQLIFTEPDILSSPVFRNDNSVYVIMTHEFFKTGKLQLQLDKLRLKVHNTISLSNDIYELCLRYTIQANIAPQWNTVGDYLVQGRDFLENKTPMNAVKMDIGMKSNELFLVLWPFSVKLLKMDIQDLDIAPKIKGQTLLDKTGDILQMYMYNKKINVLPSLKQAHIVSVSQKIPPSCPFKSYKELKRHWKNMYGYRLPESDENMMYYTVAFRPQSTLYTYPSLCVRPTGLLFLGRVDCKEVLRAFVKDMAMKMPKICGQVFTVGNKLGCAVPKLTQSSDMHCSQNLFPASQKLIPWEGELITTDVLSSMEELILSTPDVATSLSGGNVSLMTPDCSTSGTRTAAADKHLAVRKRRYPSSRPDSPPPFVPTFLPPPSQDGAGFSQSSGELSKHGTSLIKPVFSGHIGFTAPSSQTSSQYPALSMGANNKKSRARPQVQPELDVEALARADDFSRVNTTTLVKWLREQNISCKVKDKKSDLVTKVRAHLNLPLPSSTQYSM